MGLNAVIACHRHCVKTYMMRGEEPADLQRWMRDHADCFERRVVDIYRDADEYPDYPDVWEYDQRPSSAVASGSTSTYAAVPRPKYEAMKERAWTAEVQRDALVARLADIIAKYDDDSLPTANYLLRLYAAIEAAREALSGWSSDGTGAQVQPRSDIGGEQGSPCAGGS